MIAIMILNIIMHCILLIATSVMAVAAGFYSIAVDKMSSFAHCVQYSSSCYCDGVTYSKYLGGVV